MRYVNHYQRTNFVFQHIKMANPKGMENLKGMEKLDIGIENLEKID